MNTNIYWPIYRSIEKEIINLSFNIHIDDNQLGVYSSKIIDLILRASAEIESISKELYKLNGGTKTDNIKYDTDAIKHLNDLWNLEEKVVIISFYNCFMTQRELKPFIKNECRTGKTTMTYSWNNAYQNLKHDRGNSLIFGSIKYLFDVTSALYILNLYYKNQIIDLGKDATGNTFDSSLGSEIFNVKLHIFNGVSETKDYEKKADFDECIYLLKATDTTYKTAQQSLISLNAKLTELLKQQINDAIQEEESKGVTLNEEAINIIIESIKDKKSIENIKTLHRTTNFLQPIENMQYQAIANKNQF